MLTFSLVGSSSLRFNVFLTINIYVLSVKPYFKTKFLPPSVELISGLVDYIPWKLVFHFITK